jgi:hypothetical protein
LKAYFAEIFDFWYIFLLEDYTLTYSEHKLATKGRVLSHKIGLFIEIRTPSQTTILVIFFHPWNGRPDMDTENRLYLSIVDSSKFGQASTRRFVQDKPERLLAGFDQGFY